MGLSCVKFLGTHLWLSVGDMALWFKLKYEETQMEREIYMVIGALLTYFVIQGDVAASQAS